MPGFELIGDEERQAVNKLFDDGAVLFAHGFDELRNGRYHVREFESKFAKKMGVNYKLLKIHNPWLIQNHLNNKSRKYYEIAIPEEGYY